MAWYLAAPPIRTEASRERKYISGADGNRGEIAAPSFSTRHISLRIIVSSRGCKTRFQAFVRDFRRYKWGGIGRRAAQGSMRPTVRNKARSRTKKKKLIEIKQRLGSDWLGSKRDWTGFNLWTVCFAHRGSDELGGKIGRNFARVDTPSRFLATSDAFSRHYYSPFLLLSAALVSSLRFEHHFFSPFFLCLSLFISLALFVRSNRRVSTKEEGVERSHILVPLRFQGLIDLSFPLFRLIRSRFGSRVIRAFRRVGREEDLERVDKGRKEARRI